MLAGEEFNGDVLGGDVVEGRPVAGVGVIGEPNVVFGAQPELVEQPVEQPGE